MSNALQNCCICGHKFNHDERRVAVVVDFIEVFHVHVCSTCLNILNEIRKNHDVTTLELSINDEGGD